MLNFFRSSIRRTAYFMSAAVVCVSLLVGASAWWSIEAGKLLATIQHDQVLAFHLTDELRQSSEDRTRLVRTYAVTTDMRYEQQYNDVLAIRNGTKERPIDYHLSHWDLVAAGLPTAGGSGETASLRELMKKAHFKKQELELLEEVHAHSDHLIRMEVEAVNAVKGMSRKADGSYQFSGASDPDRAVEILHSEEYHDAKGEMLLPLNEFQKTVEHRLESEINDVRTEMMLAGRLLEGSSVALVCLGLVLALVMVGQIVRPVVAISEVMQKLNDGEAVERIPGMRARNEIGTMARLTSAFKDKSEEALQLAEQVRRAAERNEEVANQQAEAAEEARKAQEHEKELMAEAVRQAERASVFQKELADVIQAYSEGDFAPRITAEDKEDMFREMAEGINKVGTSIESSLGDIRTVLNALEKGQLGERIRGSHTGVFKKISHILNGTCETLSGTIERISRSGKSIDGATEEVTVAARQVSRQAEQVAASLEQTASTVTDLTGAVRATSESAQHAKSIATETEGETRVCVEISQQTVEAMEGVKNSSAEISQIIKLIDDIAFQTNLLALNAGVEAAHAGDAGRGFAVVASEVQSLAQRSSDAAKKIKHLIDRSEEEVRNGVQKVQQSSTGLDKILEAIIAVTGEITSIADATHSQTRSIEEISTTITELDRVTQQNVARFEETTAAAQSLREEAATLAVEVGQFTVEPEVAPRVVNG